MSSRREIEDAARSTADIPLASANGRVPSSNRPARILAWPKRLALNPYFATISEGLEHKGWSIKDFTYIRALAGRFDILHIHFPTFPFHNRRLWITAGRLLILSSLMILLRARKRRIAWTVHNLAHHEAYHPELEKRFMVWFTDKLDLTIHLTDSGRAAAFEKFPRLRHRPSVVIPHAHYGEPPPNGVTRAGAAERLGWAKNVPILLFFGRNSSVQERSRAHQGIHPSAVDGRASRDRRPSFRQPPEGENQKAGIRG